MAVKFDETFEILSAQNKIFNDVFVKVLLQGIHYASNSWKGEFEKIMEL